MSMYNDHFLKYLLHVYIGISIGRYKDTKIFEKDEFLNAVSI